MSPVGSAVFSDGLRCGMAPLLPVGRLPTRPREEDGKSEAVTKRDSERRERIMRVQLVLKGYQSFNLSKRR